MKLSTDTIEQLLRHLDPKFRETWKASERLSAFDDARTILIQPRVFAEVKITERALRGLEYDRVGFVDWLFGELRRAQCDVIDILDKSVGRDKRVEGKVPPGKCHFCGAPYHERP